MLKWADDTQKFLIKSINNKRLIHSGSLTKSVEKQVLGITTDVKTFVFKYNKYGMFVDMGLFGGKSLADKQDDKLVASLLGRKKYKESKNKKTKVVRLTRKRQYQWYSRTMYGAINVLGYLLMEQYGNKAVNAFKLPEIIEV